MKRNMKVVATKITPIRLTHLTLLGIRILIPNSRLTSPRSTINIIKPIMRNIKTTTMLISSQTTCLRPFPNPATMPTKAMANRPTKTHSIWIRTSRINNPPNISNIKPRNNRVPTWTTHLRSRFIQAVLNKLLTNSLHRIIIIKRLKIEMTAVVSTTKIAWECHRKWMLKVLNLSTRSHNKCKVSSPIPLLNWI